MSKRSVCDTDLSNQANDVLKRPKPCDLHVIQNVTSSEDLELRVLIIQNSNLARRCQELKDVESDLKSKIDGLKTKNHKQECIIAILLQTIIHNNQDVKALLSVFGEFSPDGKEIVDTFESAYSFVQKFSHSSEQIISEEIKIALSDNFNNLLKLVNIVNNCEIKNPSVEFKNCHENHIDPSNFIKNRSMVEEYDFVRHRYAASQEEVIKLQNHIDELTYDLTRTSHRYDVLYSNYLSVKQRSNSEDASNSQQKPPDISDELKSELASYKEIASARLEELKNLQSNYTEVLNQFNRLKYSQPSNNSDIKSQPDYITLSHRLDLLLNDSLILKEQVDTYRELYQTLAKQRELNVEEAKKTMREFRALVKEALDRLHKELYQAKMGLNNYQNLSNKNMLANKTLDIDASFIKTMESLKEENSRLRSQMLKKSTDGYCNATVNWDDINQLRDKVKSLQEENAIIIEELGNLTNLYEDIQRQNLTFLQQIKETESAHISSLTENLKLTQLQKALNEDKESMIKEKEIRQQQMESFKNQFNNFEEQINQLRECLNIAIKESESKSHLCDQYKKKMQELSYKNIEASAISENLKSSQEEHLQLISESESRLENELFKNRRLYEDLAIVKRKLDRTNHNNYGGATDKILVEELRILKQKLICSCCSMRQKDAILTKCYHLFCFECLATTYNTRQRKCPRCGQSFGNHDFHKIYF